MICGHVHGEGDHEQQAVAKVNLHSIVNNYNDLKMRALNLVTVWSILIWFIVLCKIWLSMAGYGYLHIKL